jgi:hypothetical protein
MTGSWYSKNLGDAMLAGESLDRIRAQFLSAYRKAENPGQMAAFVRHQSEGDLHCEVRVFFTPASVVVAKTAGATPCAPPRPDGLGLLAGAEDSLARFFPGHGN